MGNYLHAEGDTLLSLYSSLVLKFTVVLNQSMEKLLYVISICFSKAVLGRFVKAVIIFLPLAVWSLCYIFWNLNGRWANRTYVEMTWKVSTALLYSTCKCTYSQNVYQNVWESSRAGWTSWVSLFSNTIPQHPGRNENVFTCRVLSLHGTPSSWHFILVQWCFRILQNVTCLTKNTAHLFLVTLV